MFKLLHAQTTAVNQRNLVDLNHSTLSIDMGGLIDYELFYLSQNLPLRYAIGEAKYSTTGLPKLLTKFIIHNCP